MNKGSHPFRIIIGGDVCPIGRYESVFVEADAGLLLQDIAPAWNAADLRLVNLECPLVTKANPIYKTGPNLGASPRVINGLSAISVNVVGVANNHILDHGANALLATLNARNSAGIVTVGAGADLNAASEPVAVEKNGFRVGIMAKADSEWTLAKRRAPVPTHAQWAVSYTRERSFRRNNAMRSLRFCTWGQSITSIPIRPCKKYVEAWWMGA